MPFGNVQAGYYEGQKQLNTIPREWLFTQLEGVQNEICQIELIMELFCQKPLTLDGNQLHWEKEMLPGIQ